MKLPFDFGVKLFFRLLLPGFLLSLGFAPVLLTAWDWIRRTFPPYSIHDEIAFVIAVILLGWLVIICDVPIYTIFEGRRYWPKFVKEYFKNREKKTT